MDEMLVRAMTRKPDLIEWDETTITAAAVPGARICPTRKDRGQRCTVLMPPRKAASTSIRGWRWRDGGALPHRFGVAKVLGDHQKRHARHDLLNQPIQLLCLE
jgi:hypothetical protein